MHETVGFIHSATPTPHTKKGNLKTVLVLVWKTHSQGTDRAITVG